LKTSSILLSSYASRGGLHLVPSSLTSSFPETRSSRGFRVGSNELCDLDCPRLSRLLGGALTSSRDLESCCHHVLESLYRIAANRRCRLSFRVPMRAVAVHWMHTRQNHSANRLHIESIVILSWGAFWQFGQNLANPISKLKCYRIVCRERRCIPVEFGQS